jgi:hypothetical protein
VNRSVKIKLLAILCTVSFVLAGLDIITMNSLLGAAYSYILILLGLVSLVWVIMVSRSI